MAIFSNLNKCLPEVVGDVIFCLTFYWVGTDVHAKFGNARLNSGQIIIIRLFYVVLCSVKIAFCSWSEAASYIYITVGQICGEKH